MRNRFRKYLLIFGLCAAALMTGGCARSDAKLAYDKGCEALIEGNSEEAVSYFSGVIETGYYLSAAYRGMGIAYMKQSDYADACVAFERSLLELDDESETYQRDVNLYLAACRELQGRTDKVREIYDYLIRRNPDTEVLFLRGRLNLREGDSEAAKADFDLAVSMSADYDLYISIYELYDEADRSGDGAAYLEQALAIAQANETEYYEQGLVSYYLQNYEEAKEHLIKALREDENNSEAVFLLGKVYLAMNDVPNARAVYQEYTSDEDATIAAGAYNGLVLCDIAEGDYDSATENVEKGLACDSTAQGLLYNEIVICEQQRNWSKARVKAADYVSKYPTDEAGLREYKFLSTR